MTSRWDITEEDDDTIEVLPEAGPDDELLAAVLWLQRAGIVGAEAPPSPGLSFDGWDDRTEEMGDPG